MNKHALVFLIVLVLLLFYIALAPPSTKWNKREITVQKGDTLYKISEMFNTTVSELKRINNLTTDILQVGQRLLISEENIEMPSSKIYTVQKGDTIFMGNNE